MGRGRLSEFLVRITCFSLISGDAKKNTVKLQHSRPKINKEDYDKNCNDKEIIS